MFECEAVGDMEKQSEKITSNCEQVAAAYRQQLAHIPAADNEDSENEGGEGRRDIN